jgi:hypothetical protein
VTTFGRQALTEMKVLDNIERQLNPNVMRMANDDFENAYRRGFWRHVVNWFTQKEDTLLPFDEVRKRLPISGQHSIGIQEVPVDQIVGSVGRYNDFDHHFLPRHNKTKERWMSIDLAHIKDVVLPPIEVYKIGSLYFVNDGNHRVSVAREHGQVFIDANVIEINVPYPVNSETDLDELVRKFEYDGFMKETHLNELIPDEKFELTLAGGYKKLAEHIHCHQWFMGEHQKHAIAWSDAVKDWYNGIYQPLVKEIRENKVLKDFEGRTETDLYLWIVEHLWFLREEHKEDVTMQEAVQHFTSEFVPNPLKNIENIIRMAASAVIDGIEDVFSSEDEGSPQKAPSQAQVTSLLDGPCEKAINKKD